MFDQKFLFEDEVSVFVLTYNQEKYISQTLDSILSQNTTFSFQIVIGEDFSNDSTRLICEEYANKFGSKIKLLPCLGENIGLIRNYYRTFKECKGKYIAICDGDDYWIDNSKLQKQFDFLENNKEYSIVHTALKCLTPDNVFNVINKTTDTKFENFVDVLSFNPIYSVTVFFKNFQHEDELPHWIISLPYGDWTTYLMTLRNGGKVYFMNDITSVYRKNLGVSSKLKNWYELDTKMFQFMLNDSNFDNNKLLISNILFNRNCIYFSNLNAQRKYLKSLCIFLKLFKEDKNRFFLLKKYIISFCKSIFTKPTSDEKKH